MQSRAWFNSETGANMLSCWVYGEAVTKCFAVNISQMKTVGGLKKAIKKKKKRRFHDVDANNLDLYSVSCPDRACLQETLKRWTLEGKICLDPLDELSDLNLSGSCIIIYGLYNGACSLLHFIILLYVLGLGTAHISINCWVRGHAVDQTLLVSISRTTTVGALARLIKTEKSSEFAHVDANQLFLYRISDVTHDALAEVAETITYENPLSGAELLSRLFPFPPSKTRVHIVVDVPSLSGFISQSWLRLI